MTRARMAKGRWPLFRAWIEPAWMAEEGGWDFGFYLAPWPLEEHYHGEMLNALVHLDGYFRWNPFRCRMKWHFADDSKRPVIKN